MNDIEQFIRNLASKSESSIYRSCVKLLDERDEEIEKLKTDTKDLDQLVKILMRRTDKLNEALAEALTMVHERNEEVDHLNLCRENLSTSHDEVVHRQRQEIVSLCSALESLIGYGLSCRLKSQISWFRGLRDHIQLAMNALGYGDRCEISGDGKDAYLVVVKPKTID